MSNIGKGVGNPSERRDETAQRVRDRAACSV